MERSPNPYTTEVTHNFLTDAIADGAVQRFREQSRSAKTARNLNVLGIYMGSYFNQIDIAEEARITRERVRQIVAETMEGIWNLSTPGTQIKYPIESFELNLNKRVATPRIAGGRNAQFALELSEKGLTPEEIQKLTNISLRKQKRIRIASGKLDLSEKQRAMQEMKAVWEHIAEIISTSPDDELVQRAFDILDEHHADKLVKKEDSPLISFKALFESTPTRHSTAIYDLLKEHDIPILRVRFENPKYPHYSQVSNFVLKRKSQEVLEFLENSKLKDKIKPKVIQTSGSAINLPNTHQLLNSGEYMHVFTGDIRKTVIPYSVRNPGFSYMQLLANCPITTFRYKGYYCSKKDYAQLQEFLKQRAKELGLQKKRS